MSKSNRNSGNPWTSQEVKQLKLLVKENTPNKSDWFKAWKNRIINIFKIK